MLFREDLEELVGLFEKGSESVKIIAENYKLQSVSEIDKLGKDRIAFFSINGYQKQPEWASISLTLEKNSARLRLSENAEPSLYGLASLVDKILTTKKRRRANFLRSKATIIIMYIMIIIVAIIDTLSIFKQFTEPLWLSLLSVLITVFFIILLSLQYHIITKRYTLIYTISKRTRTNFISRNKDQIILSLTVGIIVAVVTGVLTAIITSNIIHKTP